MSRHAIALRKADRISIFALRQEGTERIYLQGAHYTNPDNNFKGLQTAGDNKFVMSDTQGQQKTLISNFNNKGTSVKVGFQDDGSVTSFESSQHVAYHKTERRFAALGYQSPTHFETQLPTTSILCSA